MTFILFIILCEYDKAKFPHVIPYVIGKQNKWPQELSYVQQLLKMATVLLPSAFLTQWIRDTNTEVLTWKNWKNDCMRVFLKPLEDINTDCVLMSLNKICILAFCKSIISNTLIGCFWSFYQ